MTITYRTSGTWGAGKGSNLTATEIDTNFYGLDQRITSIESNPIEPKQIANIIVSANQMSIYLNDATQYGPFTLPTATFNPRGTWASNTAYVIGDTFFVDLTVTNDKTKTGTYLVLQDHQSDNTFNPAKTISNSLVYCQISLSPYFNKTITPTYNATIPAYTFINYNDDIYLSLEDVNPANSNALNTLITNGKVINVSNTKTLQLKNLADVEYYSQFQANKYLRVNSAGTMIDYDDVYFTELDGSPGNFTGNSNKIVRVNSAGTSLEYHTLKFTDLSDTQSSYVGSGGKFVTVKSDESGLEFTTGPSATFLALTDTPSTYSGSENKFVAVNSGGTALEFITKPTYAFTQLSDAPQNYTGAASKYIAVNSSGTGLEFVPQSGASGVSALNFAATQTPTGVTNVEFLNIPSYVKRINIHFSGLSLSGTADYLVQLGNASGYLNTNYTSVHSFLRTSANGSTNFTTGFSFYGSVAAATTSGCGSLILLDSASAIWCWSCIASSVDGTNYRTTHAGGSKSFGAGFVPTKLKVVSSNGTDTFDAGSISISYE